jgi:hypothetical protein
VEENLGGEIVETDNWYTLIAPPKFKFSHIYGQEKDKNRYDIETIYPPHVSNEIDILIGLTPVDRSLVLTINNKSDYPVFVKIKFDGKPILDKSFS